MFKKRPKKIQRQKDLYVRPLLPAILVFMALYSIILASWHTAKQDITTQRTTIVNQNAEFIEGTLQQRFSIYEDSLRAAKGLFLSSDDVNRDEWGRFVGSLDLANRYPGIRGLGYIPVVQASDKEAFQAHVRENDLSTFTINPASDQAQSAPLLYVVPIGSNQTTDRNAPALGFDMYTDPTRKRAMIVSLSANQPVLSDVINLVQAAPGRAPNRGFLMFMPLFRLGMPISSDAERQAALQGYFYAPFVTDDVFKSMFRSINPSFNFAIYDGEPSAETLLYKSSAAFDNPEYAMVKTNTIKFYGQDWTMQYKARPDLISYTVRNRPAGVLLGGTIFSGALALIIYLLIQRRTRALSYLEQKKLEEAKDELLSIASHQLRTPATAVKQYVSMVKDGFAGKVTSEQQSLLQMAYDSNERQLTIVDDLLYVARLDAGQAKLRPEMVNISEMITSVVQDQGAVIRERKQKVSVNLPLRPVKISADPQYIRMILENLLSNASKYSHKKTDINVVLKTGPDDVIIKFIDHGVGIEREDFSNVFMKFSRIPNELTKQIAGSGIGLYLARQLALLHGGDITFTSTLGKGSTFRVRLPRKK